MILWIIILLCAVGVSVWIIRPLFLSQVDILDNYTHDIEFYKSQLKELDDDLARGVINKAEAHSAALEISKRMLSADRKRTYAPQIINDPKLLKDKNYKNHMMAVLIALFICGGSLGLYAILGSPYLPDQPLMQRLAKAKIARANRPSQIMAEQAINDPIFTLEPEYEKLLKQLRDALAKNPNDITGLRLLSLHEMRSGNYKAARKAHSHLMTLLADKATTTDIIDHAERMIIAVNGYVSPQAEAELVRALERAPQDGRVRYYSGLAMAQNGRPDGAYKLWQKLLKEGPEDAPWIAPIKSQINSVAIAAGFNPPEPLPNINSNDFNEIENLSEKEQNAMIYGMVNNLANRLATKGGSVSQWARLIRALGVLGETQRASAIWKEAKEVFKEDTQGLYLLDQAAQEAQILQ